MYRKQRCYLTWDGDKAIQSPPKKRGIPNNLKLTTLQRYSAWEMCCPQLLNKEGDKDRIYPWRTPRVMPITLFDPEDKISNFSL